MTGQTQNHTLVSLRIEVTPYSSEDRMVQFTGISETGAATSLTVQVPASTLADARDALASLAAHPSASGSGFAFGRGDTDRLALEFSGYTAGQFALNCTFAYAGGMGGGYNTVTLAAQVSDASLGRLVDGFTQLKDVEQGTYDWTVAG